MYIFFNNCNNRDHANEYETDEAFYDLNTDGLQANQASNLPVGQQCIVASLAPKGKVIFQWFSFKYEKVEPDSMGNPCRVFHGKFIKKSEPISKEAAAKDLLYSVFFDKNGHVKRQSVIQE